MSQRVLYHLPLSPFSRKVRLLLAEKNLPFSLKAEQVWDRRPQFLALNPAGQVPVLVEPDGAALTHSQVITEYLEEVFADPELPLLGTAAIDKAETRRLVLWFDEKFYDEVGDLLLGERVTKRLMRQGQPDAAAIRAGLANIHYHLDYIRFLMERRRWLAGDRFGLADMAAAAHLSCLDYLDDIPWQQHPAAKEWYARVKSRPSFRPLLDDQVAGVPPARHYADLDF